MIQIHLLIFLFSFYDCIFRRRIKLKALPVFRLNRYITNIVVCPIRGVYTIFPSRLITKRYNLFPVYIIRTLFKFIKSSLICMKSCFQNYFVVFKWKKCCSNDNHCDLFPSRWGFLDKYFNLFSINRVKCIWCVYFG